MAAENQSVEAVIRSAENQAGVNDRNQLAHAERVIQARIIARHREAGVAIAEPAYIDDAVRIEQDASIGPGVCLRGQTSIGTGARIDAGSVVTDSTIGAESVLLPYTIVDQSGVGARTQLGPFAHLRPQSLVEDEAKVGNFVELKKTRLRRGAKANHLSYIGDGDVGERANLGAGTIFCNYDGFSKAKTIIGNDVFVGSDSQLVAPLIIGDGAYVATGTTVTEDIPPDGFAIGRCRQTTKLDYASKLKAKLKARKG
jgi:bifunctional UDP-N-acetylglucosamine pyrophosphorylase/glucosamine-1-phosphate N-acetyltransferase